jgi:LysM repeat protein
LSLKNKTPENPENPARRRQRFKPSVLEVMIGSLIVLGLMYLAYLVQFKDTGEPRGMEGRVKALEARVDQRESGLEQGMKGVKEFSQQLEARVKALEENRKQVDSRMAALAPVKTAVPPKAPLEDGKPAVSGPGKEKITHRVKKGETLSLIGRNYGVRTQDIIQWNKLPPGKAIKPDDKLIIHKR